MSFGHLQDWIGRTEERSDIASAAPVAGLAATLDHVDPPWRVAEVPPLGHWLYFLPRERQSDLAGDGHARRGAFLPPVDLPRRMWAGGEFEFIAPLPLGAPIRRLSTIKSVDHKKGRSGDMVFVKVEHEITAGGVLALREVHEIVYREAPKPGEAPAPAVLDKTRPADFSREIAPSPVLLFRFSALTFNGHRIHYDRGYCENVEGYPGLVVHGPLTATLLMDLYLRQKPASWVKAFRFRARRPLFDIDPFTIHGAHKPRGAALWALDRHGAVAMTAELEAS